MLEAVAVDVPPVGPSRHAAALYLDGRLLAVGVNSYKTHPIMPRFQPNPLRLHLHAEADAVRQVISKYGEGVLSLCSLRVLRLTEAGRRGNSCPCKGCWKMINHFNIKDVQWTMP